MLFNLVWTVLSVWTCLAPGGYVPYILLGFNAGDFIVKLYCGLEFGYLEEEDDFSFGSFLLSFLGFGLLGGFYIGGLSFAPGSDAYNNAIYVVFVAALTTFFFRFLQYGLARLPKA